MKSGTNGLTKLLAVFLWISSISSMFLLSSQISVGIIQLLLIVSLGYLLYKKEHSSKSNVLLGALSLAAILELLWIFVYAFNEVWPMYFKVRFTYLIAQLIITTVSMYILLSHANLKFKNQSVGRKLGTVGKSVLTLAGLTISLYFLVAVVTPNLFNSIFAVPNSYESNNETTATVQENGVTYINDVQYGSEYPRSFLDIYQNPKATKDSPTLVYVHGGGFIAGDKAFGDPNGATAGIPAYRQIFFDLGYNFVAINYAFSPEYAYPVPVIQMTQAVKFLQKNAEKYHLNMDKVVISGGSAGGNIIGQFAAVQTNPAYSKEVGIEPILTNNELKAAVFDSALLDSIRAHKTGYPVVDFAFGEMIRAYMQASLLKDIDKNYIQAANIIANVTESFPPSFINDGTNSSFPDQATDMYNRLVELDIPAELNIAEGEAHMYTNGTSAAAKDNLAKLKTFLGKTLK